MIKKSFYALALIALVLSAPAQAVEYSKVISDLPLMEGMVENPDQGISFDKPDGRILKTSANVSMAPQAVLAFYKSALPALGWSVAEGADPNPLILTYQRKEELLLVSAMQIQGGTQASFNIIPLTVFTDKAQAAAQEALKQQKQRQ